MKDYLTKIKAPQKVFLSEDGSGIIQKVVYDVKTNQLIGLVLPIDDNSGFPKPFTFMATSEETIKNLMTMPTSSLIYIIVAQPLIENSTPFIVQMFGTNSKFNKYDVLNRWTSTISELKRYIIYLPFNSFN